MRMNIVLILIISIYGISCLDDGMPIDSLPTYSNFIVTIWEYGNINRDICSGTVITPNHILTTGFCVSDVRGYDIYVTARGTDPHVKISQMVHKIHRYHDLRKVDDLQELWLNNIAILHLDPGLPWGLNIEPIPLNYQRWNDATFMECHLIGYNINFPTITPQWSTVVIAPNSCVAPGISRLPHEVFAVSTTLAIYTSVDLGTSLICNGTAIGMIVQRVQNVETAAVLIYAFYQDFIEYIIAGGVAEIGESAVHVVVAIFESGKFRCGGFAVHNRYVVTAAHCVDGKEKANLSVAFSHVEIPRMNSASEWLSVESIVIHPLYPLTYKLNLGENIIRYNIAVLKVKSDLPWNPLIRLKDLPDPKFISGDRPCEILRWIDPSSRDTESKILMKSYVAIHDGNRYFPSGGRAFLVKGFYDLPISTNNDIGNPIIFENNIIGMVIDISQSVMGPINHVICLKIRLSETFIRDVMNKP